MQLHVEGAQERRCLNRGEARAKNKDYDGAIADLEQLLRLAPDIVERPDLELRLEKIRAQRKRAAAKGATSK